MNLKSAFPVMVMAFMLLTGALFLAAGLADVSFLSVDPSRRMPVTVLAVVLMALSLLFFVAWRRGDLKKQGRSLLEVRMRTIRKVKERSTLVQIADDPDEVPEVRALAAERLKEMEES